MHQNLGLIKHYHVLTCGILHRAHGNWVYCVVIHLWTIRKYCFYYANIGCLKDLKVVPKSRRNFAPWELHQRLKRATQIKPVIGDSEFTHSASFNKLLAEALEQLEPKPDLYKRSWCLRAERGEKRRPTHFFCAEAPVISFSFSRAATIMGSLALNRSCIRDLFSAG